MPPVQDKKRKSNQQLLIQLCLTPGSFLADGSEYSDAAITKIRKVFGVLQKGVHLKSATEELLRLSFFWQKKGADKAARQLIAIASSSTPLLKARSDKFESRPASKAENF